MIKEICWFVPDLNIFGKPVNVEFYAVYYASGITRMYDTFIQLPKSAKSFLENKIPVNVSYDKYERITTFVYR